MLAPTMTYITLVNCDTKVYAYNIMQGESASIFKLIAILCDTEIKLRDISIRPDINCASLTNKNGNIVATFYNINSAIKVTNSHFVHYFYFVRKLAIVLLMMVYTFPAHRKIITAMHITIDYRATYVYRIGNGLIS